MAELERARDFPERGGTPAAAPSPVARVLSAGAPLLSPVARCLHWAWEALGGSPRSGGWGGTPGGASAPADSDSVDTAAAGAQSGAQLRDLRAELQEARDEAARGWEAAQRAEEGRRDALRSGAAAQAELEVALEELAERLDMAASSASEVALLGEALESATRRAAELWAERETLRPRLAELEERNHTLATAAARAAELEATLGRERAEAQAAGEALAGAEAAAARQGRRVQELENALAEALAKERELAAQYLAERQGRRRVHAELQELKGNIRVVARVRPLAAPGPPPALAVVDPRRVEAVASEGGASPGAASSVLSQPERAPFEFDAALGPGASQRDVWSEVAPLVASFCDGFNVTVLAYGQTGAGKTFTMFGDDEAPGICPRAFEAVFERAAASARAGQPRCVTVSVSEVYLDRVHDLLAPQRAAADAGADAGAPPEVQKKLHRPGEEGRARLVTQQVHSLGDALALVAVARAARATAPTAVHARSSRSHAVVTVRYSGEAARRGAASTLHLVDLSGSERVHKSGVQGRGLDEARSINRSLSALGDVMAALQAKRSHVPFRNCTLTRVLEGALAPAQGAKALLVCNLDPAEASLSESLGSLHFASRAARVELGRAAPAAPTAPAASPGPRARVRAAPGAKPAAGGPPAAPRAPLRALPPNQPPPGGAAR